MNAGKFRMKSSTLLLFFPWSFNKIFNLYKLRIFLKPSKSAMTCKVLWGSNPITCKVLYGSHPITCKVLYGSHPITCKVLQCYVSISKK